MTDTGEFDQPQTRTCESDVMDVSCEDAKLSDQKIYLIRTDKKDTQNTDPIMFANASNRYFNDYNRYSNDLNRSNSDTNRLNSNLTRYNSDSNRYSSDLKRSTIDSNMPNSDSEALNQDSTVLQSTCQCPLTFRNPTSKLRASELESYKEGTPARTIPTNGLFNSQEQSHLHGLIMRDHERPHETTPNWRKETDQIQLLQCNRRPLRPTKITEPAAEKTIRHTWYRKGALKIVHRWCTRWRILDSRTPNEFGERTPLLSTNTPCGYGEEKQKIALSYVRMRQSANHPVLTFTERKSLLESNDSCRPAAVKEIVMPFPHRRLDSSTIHESDVRNHLLAPNNPCESTKGKGIVPLPYTKRPLDTNTSQNFGTRTPLQEANHTHGSTEGEIISPWRTRRSKKSSATKDFSARKPQQEPNHSFIFGAEKETTPLWNTSRRLNSRSPHEFGIRKPLLAPSKSAEVKDIMFQWNARRRLNSRPLYEFGARKPLLAPSKSADGKSSLPPLPTSPLLSLLLVTLLLCPAEALVHQEQRPSLSTPLHNLTIVAGRQARLTCVVDNLRSHQIAWSHYNWRGRAVLTVNGSVMTKNPRVSLLRERDGQFWTLVIANVTATDEGDYECQVNTAPPERVIFYISVEVPPHITRPPRDHGVREGEDVKLRCEATGDPQPALTWRREDGHTFRLNDTQVVEVRGTVLQLSGLGREDSGAFLCVASNGVPPAVSARAQVSVLFAPEMVIGKGVRWGEIGGRASLECHYKAYPAPRITWTKDGALLTHLAKTREQWDGRGTGSSTLVLHEVDADNFGHYRCLAHNRLGANSTIITLLESLSTTSSSTTPTPPQRLPPPGGEDNAIARINNNSSSTSLLRIRGAPPSSPTDIVPDRFVQEQAPPSGEYRPLPPSREAASTSGGALKSSWSYCWLNLLVLCCLHLLREAC